MNASRDYRQRRLMRVRFVAKWKNRELFEDMSKGKLRAGELYGVFLGRISEGTGTNVVEMNQILIDPIATCFSRFHHQDIYARKAGRQKPAVM